MPHICMLDTRQAIHLAGSRCKTSTLVHSSTFLHFFRHFELLKNHSHFAVFLLQIIQMQIRYKIKNKGYQLCAFILSMWLIFCLLFVLKTKQIISTLHIFNQILSCALQFTLLPTPTFQVCDCCCHRRIYIRGNVVFIQDAAFLLLLSRALQQELRVSFKKLKCEVKMFDLLCYVFM